MRFNMLDLVNSLNHLRYHLGVDANSEVDIKLIDGSSYAKEGELLTQGVITFTSVAEKEDYDELPMQTTTIIEVFPAGEGRKPRVVQTTAKELKR